MSIDYDEIQNSNALPYAHLHSKEFVEGVLKAGSFISMLENKKINTTALFSLLMESPKYQEFFAEITSCDSFKEAIYFLLQLNPSLLKSKITKSLLKKLNGKVNGSPAKPANRTRKALVQQTSVGVTSRKKQTI